MPSHSFLKAANPVTIRQIPLPRIFPPLPGPFYAFPLPGWLATRRNAVLFCTAKQMMRGALLAHRSRRHRIASPQHGSCPCGSPWGAKRHQRYSGPVNTGPVVLSKYQARCCHFDDRFCQLFLVFGPFLAGVNLTFVPTEVLANLIKNQNLGRSRMGTG